MPRPSVSEKPVNLALQGGGAHGAFTWGVLDRIFEDERIRVEAISGTSAGAMNAVVAAQGLFENGRDGARARLDEFWCAIAQAGLSSPLKRNPINVLLGDWTLDNSPGYVMMDLMNRLASPYDLNPLRINPLRDLVLEYVDFDKVQHADNINLYISATNVETGHVRVFQREEVTADVVMASACLPHIFHAVEIDGEAYWDGGFMGNPVLFPFFHRSHSSDIIIVQINPIVREEVPRTARDILNRVNEITFNSALIAEMRAIEFVRRLLDEGSLDDKRYRRMLVHMIEARKQMRPLGASSKMNTELGFLRLLFGYGREAAEHWIEAHFDDIGNRSTVDIREIVTGPKS